MRGKRFSSSSSAMAAAGASSRLDLSVKASSAGSESKLGAGVGDVLMAGALDVDELPSTLGEKTGAGTGAVVSRKAQRATLEISKSSRLGVLGSGFSTLKVPGEM
mmetsp:Transcript_8138/g.19363  ORF Transcript_8138/g.19363 Transcript_8138/m.19363 type:complete len:105 (-) Transcript_8138:59-373(-)